MRKQRQFSKTIVHDCEPPPPLVETVEYYEQPRWWQIFSEPVRRTKEVFREDHVDWQCPECDAEFSWSYDWSTGGRFWDRRNCGSKTVYANSIEALDKMTW